MRYPFTPILFAAVLTAATPLAAAPPTNLAGRLLAAHNAERARMGSAPLSWSPELAQQADGWARSLAARGVFGHSRDRNGAGENLWMGTAGAYSPEAMAAAFVDEGRNFRAGVFPQVSRTGRWSDVGHYTQLIWPATRQVGCALASGRGQDVLVCRYYPAGNVIGQRVP